MINQTVTVRHISWISIFLLFFIQVYMIIWFNGPQISDAGRYVQLARDCVSMNSIYPNRLNTNDTYINAPLFINYLSVLFRINPSLKIIYISNLLVTFVLLFSVRYIIIKLIKNNMIMYLSTILFCLLPAFWGGCVAVMTDIPYTALAFLSFAILLADKKGSPFIAGVVLSLANAVRPLALAYMIGLLAYLIIKRTSKIKYFSFFLGLLLTIMIMGFTNYLNSGYFIYQSTTSGINLIIGANDDANGGYNDICFQEGKIAYLDSEVSKNMTFKEKDSFYRKLAVGWILKHPIKWISLIPKKIFYMYGTELYFRSSFYQLSEEDDGAYSIIKKWFNGNLQFVDFILFYGQLVYMFLIIGFVLGIIRLVKQQSIIDLLPLFLIFLTGTIMTIITFGGSRFHLPYLPIFVFFTAMILYRYVFLKKEN